MRFGLLPCRAVIEIGLTGGIGSGKSTVGEAFVERGAVLIDADAIVREVQEPGGQVFDEIVELFGPGIVAADGRLDRAAIAAVVFNDPDQLAALNAVVHPAVIAEMGRRRARSHGTDDIVVLDIPLLVNAQGRSDRPEYESIGWIVVVDVDPEVAVTRLVEHRGFTEADARARIANQASREARLKVADRVLDNSADLAALIDQVDACWAWIEGLDHNSAR